MKPNEIIAVVGNTPFTSQVRGRQLYDFIIENRLGRCLELGFAHGVATVWMAGAVQEIGGSGVIAVDNQDALSRQPSAKELVAAAKLNDLVQLQYDEYSYTWHLHNHFKEYTNNPFDFIFIDGAHNWDTDGFAYCLVSGMLKPGGWLLFDDLDWSYQISPALRNTPAVKAMSPLRRETKQVRSVWENLVLPDPRFGNFKEDVGWGWAQRLPDQAPKREAPKLTVVRRSLLADIAYQIKTRIAS